LRKVSRDQLVLDAAIFVVFNAQTSQFLRSTSLTVLGSCGVPLDAGREPFSQWHFL
jgi:hypothetical protein